MLLRGDAVPSGAGFLVLWLVKEEIRPIWEWIFVGVWPDAHGMTSVRERFFLVRRLVKGEMLPMSG